MLTSWPEGPLDTLVFTFLRGAWAGLAAVVVAFTLFLIGQFGVDYSLASAAARGLYYAAIGWALAPIFAWITKRLTLPLVPAGVVFAASLLVLARAFSARMIVPFLAYGIVLALVLRSLEEPREPS
ncbi:MAG: hypothetical protein V2A73_09455 [Pseudomonadota bacterium]